MANNLNQEDLRQPITRQGWRTGALQVLGDSAALEALLEEAKSCLAPGTRRVVRNHSSYNQYQL